MYLAIDSSWLDAATHSVMESRLWHTEVRLPGRIDHLPEDQLPSPRHLPYVIFWLWVLAGQWFYGSK